MSTSIIILDANILIRAVLGEKVRNLIITNADKVNFFTPDVCMHDATKYLPMIFEKRSLPLDPALEVLSSLKYLLQIVEENIYQDFVDEAKLRLKNRDYRDWPVVATALTFSSPIWTEDKDFFGTGIPTWTSDRVHLYFQTL